MTAGGDERRGAGAGRAGGPETGGGSAGGPAGGPVTGGGSSAAAEPAPARDWRAVARRAVLWFLVAAIVLVVFWLLARYLPGWWAGTVGDLVHGEFSLGAWWGLFFGTVFTFLPVIVIGQTIRPWDGWEPPVLLTGLGLLLAAPNWLTLWVAVGPNPSARAARLVLHADAPGFGGGTGWGALIGAALGVALLLLWRGWRRRGRELRAMRHERQGAPGDVG
ncbi:hypothetical protein [Puerhibacterium puerhi]|uniref:hypothetical protein n=1 Tax=Puerhibacterium puerhi TaxID=2692623 RepID=UPI00135B6B35|nr:hypothetical protein [Puerhibacterium puerhi]